VKGGATEQIVPDWLDAERVAAEQELGELLDDRRGAAPVGGLAEADQPLVGVDLDEEEVGNWPSWMVSTAVMRMVGGASWVASG
jgi:hypothetical protein